MTRFPLFLLCLALASCSTQSVNTYRGSFSAPKLPPPGGSPNIFQTYSATEDAVMMDGWARDFDMSGVSFNERMTVTLVTKRHVIMAKHYQRKPGSKVVFHNRNGKRLERTIMKVRAVYSDVAVGLLDLDVPSDYKIYCLPAPQEDYSHLIGKTAVLTDQNRRLFFHQIRSLSRDFISFIYHKPNLHGWGKKLVGGDSGNPSFLISDNDLILIETHTSGGGGSGPFYGKPELQERLQEEITRLAPGYRFRTKEL